jgi:hypothetical protein
MFQIGDRRMLIADVRSTFFESCSRFAKPYAAGNVAPHRAQCDHPGCTVPLQPGQVFESASPQTEQNVNDAWAWAPHFVQC